MIRSQSARDSSSIAGIFREDRRLIAGSTTVMSADAALAFIEAHGVVLVGARGPVPRLVEAIAGEPIEGKVTVVHRRLWPALVRLAHRFTPQQLAQIKQEHTDSGKHINRIVDFPRWVPGSVRAAARELSDAEAEHVLAALLGRDRPRTAAKKTPRSRATAAASRKRARGT